MLNTITLSRDVIDLYDILEIGILIVDRKMGIKYSNPWINSRLPENLQHLKNLNQVAEHYPYASALSRIWQVFQDLQPVIMSPALHKFIIPLLDIRNTDRFMHQQGIVKPVLIASPGTNEKTVHAFIQITNVSNMRLQMAELEKAVSDRKEAEINAKAAMRQADEANQAKSEFLANMSHELRTPLNAIIGYTEILYRKLEKGLDEKQQGFLGRIRESSEHLLEMVNDILDLTKIEAKKAELEIEPFDFNEMVKRVTSVIQSQALKKKIQIELDLPADQEWIDGDEKRLKQILYNLLSNAIKFTESGKRIGVTTAVEENDFLVTVWDEGIGISPEHLKDIFEPFEQRHKKVSSESGTGLGLSITKKLIEMHSGQIIVSSKPGKGSRFFIRLPGRIKGVASSEKTDTLLPSTTAYPDYNDVHILITEDNEINRDVLGELLEDFQVEFATTGEEAVEKAQSEKYSLIFMDIQLPGINGIEAMKQIRQTISNPPPIIALTALAMRGDREDLISKGFDDYIPKPLDIDILIQLIQQSAEQKSTFDET